VIITYNQPRGFSGIFGSSSMPVYARAVAGGIPGNIGIFLLDPSITVSGQLMTTINILNGGQIYCNSNSSVENSEFKGYGWVGGVYLESSANVTCGGINIVGSVTQESGSALTFTNGGGIQTGVGPWSDPLANVPEPTLPSGKGTSINANSNTTISAGLYSTIQLNNASATLTMNPGIYYITGGINIQAGSLVGNGVMIYNTSGDNLKFQGATSVNLTPPTSGTYAGISIWQPRSDSSEVHIESTGNVTISGTLYAQSGEFDIRPDGATTVFNMGNYICDQAEWGQGYDSKGGKSNGTIRFNPYTAAATQRPSLVE
jgi:hypothetical protein